MSTGECKAILAAGLAALALAAAPPATASDVAVVVKERLSLRALRDRGAIGLLVPGKGPTVSRSEALRALERTVAPCGKPRPCRVRVLVSLPPPGEHHNVRRYPIAVVGGGYQGVLVSERTRIPGLISIFDVAPAVRALEERRRPAIRWRSEPDAPATLARLDRRLAQAHDSRLPATLVLVASILANCALALALRSRLFGRAALLAAPMALTGSLALSALGVARPATVTVLLALLAGAGSVAAAAVLATPRRLALALAGVLALYLVVLGAWPEVNSLAAIGAHPDGGGRFYGVTNQLQTLLLVPALVSAGLLGPRWIVPIAVLALVTVGASRTGADGGGVLVLAAGFLMLGLRMRGVPLTPRLAALLTVATVAIGGAFVALDAASGGSSHVTDAVREGPLALAGELAHRLNVSFQGATSSWYAVLLMLLSLGALVWFALRRPRFPPAEALLVALAVSLLVNDTPRDVAGFGALCCAALWSWQHVRLTAA